MEKCEKSSALREQKEADSIVRQSISGLLCKFLHNTRDGRRWITYRKQPLSARFGFVDSEDVTVAPVSFSGCLTFTVALKRRVS